METEMARLEARVRGRVQAVGFRAFVYDRARQLGLSGAARNEEDGSVYVLAEGPRPALDALLAALHRGPPLARVESVAVQWAPARGGPGGRFEVGG